MPNRADRPDRPARTPGAVSSKAPPESDAPALVRRLTGLCTQLESLLDLQQRYQSLLTDHVELRERHAALDEACDDLKERLDDSEQELDDLKEEYETLMQAHRDLQTAYTDTNTLLTLARK